MMFRYGEAQGILVRMFGPFRTIQWMPAVELALLAGAVALGLFAPSALAGAVLLGLGALAFLLRLRAPDTRTAVAVGVLLVPAIWEWHLGFLKGLREGPPPEATAAA